MDEKPLEGAEGQGTKTPYVGAFRTPLDVDAPAGKSLQALDQEWPPLPFEQWKDTCETLHMWTQIVGKVKLELCPFLNEWWQVAFHLSARGMTTGIIPYGSDAFEVRFDFVDHELYIHATNGGTKALPLVPQSVAAFYREFMASLEALGIKVAVNPMPSEVNNPVPCDVDEVHASYDAESVRRWWLIQVQIEKVLQRYRASFAGKSSPVQFFWGSFDLNHTRFSGRLAEPPKGAPRFFQMAEDQENIASGFWPGNANSAGLTFGEPAFYSYIYPAPAGYAEATVAPAGARFDTTLGEFILPYEDARRSPSPEDAILQFFQSTYEAAANLAKWDRARLEIETPARA